MSLVGTFEYSGAWTKNFMLAIKRFLVEGGGKVLRITSDIPAALVIANLRHVELRIKGIVGKHSFCKSSTDLVGAGKMETTNRG